MINKKHAIPINKFKRTNIMQFRLNQFHHTTSLVLISCIRRCETIWTHYVFCFWIYCSHGSRLTIKWHLFLVHSSNEKWTSRWRLSMRSSTYLTVACIRLDTRLWVIHLHQCNLRGDVRKWLSDVNGTISLYEMPTFFYVIII